MATRRRPRSSVSLMTEVDCPALEDMLEIAEEREEAAAEVAEVAEEQEIETEEAPAPTAEKILPRASTVRRPEAKPEPSRAPSVVRRLSDMRG